MVHVDSLAHQFIPRTAHQFIPRIAEGVRRAGRPGFGSGLSGFALNSDRVLV
jgi:hypothetical protein